MIKPFSSNPQLEKWRPSKKTISNIEKARELWGLEPEDIGDETNKFLINAINTAAYFYTTASPEELCSSAEETCNSAVRNRERRKGK